MIRQGINLLRRVAGTPASTIRAEKAGLRASKQTQAIQDTLAVQEGAIKGLGLETAAEKEILEGVGKGVAEEYKKINKTAVEDIMGKGGIKGVVRRNPIKTTAGVLGGGAVAYNMMGKSGTPVENNYVSPEEAGAQAALMDTMQQAGPMMQVSGADAQHMGMVNEMALQRG